MTSTPSTATVPVPLTADMHRLAQEFYAHHAQPAKAKQVYLNTLSVCAVQFYLTCLGIETDLDQNHSWNLTLQTLSDGADLWVQGLGRLECRPVLPGMQACPVPPEAWSDRIGYVAVQFNPELTEADLLGFVAQVTADAIPLGHLQALAELPQWLQSLRSPAEATIRLRHWLEPWVQPWLEAGWETLETIRQSLQGDGELAYSFRQSLSQEIAALETSTQGAKRGKRLQLINPSDTSISTEVLLLVEIAPRPPEAETEEEFQITVELVPLNASQPLPRSLHLRFLDAAGQVVLQADGSHSDGLEFQASGSRGERFTVQVVWQEQRFEEHFEI
jgi:hypothetical protein